MHHRGSEDWHFYLGRHFQWPYRGQLLPCIRYRNKLQTQYLFAVFSEDCLDPMLVFRGCFSQNVLGIHPRDALCHPLALDTSPPRSAQASPHWGIRVKIVWSACANPSWEVHLTFPCLEHCRICAWGTHVNPLCPYGCLLGCSCKLQFYPRMPKSLPGVHV